MLNILAWLAVLTAVLFALGETMRPWRSRHWFKLLFLPGILLAVGVQAVAAKLCAETDFKSSPLREGEAAFFMQKTELPPVAGACFVLVSHALLFAFFVGSVALFESLSALDPAAVLLPGVLSTAPEEPLASSASASDAARQVSVGFRLVPYLLILYLVVPAFANLRLRAREYVGAGLLLLLLALLHFSDPLGLGFPFASRLRALPPWWGAFSLYVMTAGVGLAAAAVARAGTLIVSAPEARRRGAIKVKLGHVENEPVPQETAQGDNIVYE